MNCKHRKHSGGAAEPDKEELEIHLTPQLNMTLSHIEDARKTLAAADMAYGQCYLHNYSKCMSYMIIWHRILVF